MISAAVHLLTWKHFIVLQQWQVRDATRWLQCHNHRSCRRRILLLYCNSVCRHLSGESAEISTSGNQLSCFVLSKKDAARFWCTCRVQWQLIYARFDFLSILEYVNWWPNSWVWYAWPRPRNNFFKWRHQWRRASIVSQQSSQDTLVTSGQWWTYRRTRDSLCMLSPRHVTRQHVCGSEKTRESTRQWGYYSNTRGLSRVPVWYMMRPSLGEKNVRMTTGNCVLVNWDTHTHTHTHTQTPTHPLRSQHYSKCKYLHCPHPWNALW